MTVEERRLIGKFDGSPQEVGRTGRGGGQYGLEGRVGRRSSPKGVACSATGSAGREIDLGRLGMVKRRSEAGRDEAESVTRGVRERDRCLSRR